MKKECLNVTRKTGPFFNTIKIENNCKIDDVSEYMYSTIKEIMADYDIEENRIQEVKYKVVRKNKKEKIVLYVRFAKIDLEALRKLPEDEQLRIALKCIGYHDFQIRNIEYKKYWINSPEKIWVATVNDPNYLFDPDEAYGKREYTATISNAIYEVLDFHFIIELTRN